MRNTIHRDVLENHGLKYLFALYILDLKKFECIKLKTLLLSGDIPEGFATFRNQFLSSNF